MRHTVKVLSYILISSIVTSLVFAGDKKTEEEILKIKQIEQRKHDLEPVCYTHLTLPTICSV